MKFLFLILLAVWVCGDGSLIADEFQTLSDPASADAVYLPGVSLATGMSEITGVAISPLLGVSGVGLWTYFRTPAEHRGSLPWYCQPLAWGIGLFILTLCFFKDTLGAMLPPFFKKPLDLIELFENKASALIASAAFVPLVVDQISVHLAATEGAAAGSGALTSGVFLAQASPVAAVSVSLHWFLLPLCLVGFFLVWIVSHAINILILLSPFALLDTLLKAARLSLLSVLAVAYAINPVLAAILSGLVILVAAILAPSAFRLAVFGTFMGMDYLRSVLWRERESESVRGFLARRGGKLLKARAFGSLRQSDDGGIVFESRFCFFGPVRSLNLTNPESLVIRNGMLFPSVLRSGGESGAPQCLFHLLPRHRHQVHRISEALGMGEARETALNRGIVAMKAWLRETLRAGKGTLIAQVSEGGNEAG
ncbi:MAG: hypothetical protein P1U86_11610 [Verrucomicrobiales bacterium]|nr:hypothetical protein [Verrucomicrobiales bacterium]